MSSVRSSIQSVPEPIWVFVASLRTFRPSLATRISGLERRPGLPTRCPLAQMSCKTHDGRETPRGLPGRALDAAALEGVGLDARAHLHRLPPGHGRRAE